MSEQQNAAFEIVRDLAACEPTAPSEIDGDPSCFFCGAYFPPSIEQHAPTCLWRRARELAGAS